MTDIYKPTDDPLALPVGSSLAQLLPDAGVTLSPCAHVVLANLNVMSHGSLERIKLSTTGDLMFEMEPWKMLGFALLVSDAKPRTVFLLPILCRLLYERSAPSNSLYAWVSTTKPISLEDVAKMILGGTFEKGIVIHFATRVFFHESKRRILSYISTEGYGRFLFTTPLADLPLCHPRNFWAHGTAA